MNFFNATMNLTTHPGFRTLSSNSLAPDTSEHILCHYINATSQLEIARITNISNWYFERVVFPGQRLLFEAPRWAKLEIYTGKTVSAILADQISCERLQVKEGFTLTSNY